jgi:hypothetical protein
MIGPVHPPPVVVAHYMHCYILGAITDKDMQERKTTLDLVETPDDWPPSETIERSWWSSRLAPLAQAGGAGVEADFDLAETAGLDALSILIGPHHLPESDYAAGLRLAAFIAAHRKVKLIPDLWDNWSSGHPPAHIDFIRYGQAVKALMDQNPGSFLTYHGRPVIILGNPLRNGAQAGFGWTDYKAVFEPWGGPQAIYIILNCRSDRERISDDWSRAADAFSLWAATQGWNDPQNSVLTDLAAQYGKAMAWPVSASYYGGRHGTESLAESLGASRFTDQWRRAIRSKAEFVIVQTWNDFSEDHAITETNYRGTSLIELNRNFANWAHCGHPIQCASDAIFLFHHRQLVGAHLSQSTISAHNDAWHLTPTTDYIDVVTILREPGRVRLKSGREVWERDVPAGLHEWLVYVPSQKFDPGPFREAYTRPHGSYPGDSEERSVTVATAVSAGFVCAAVLRGERTVATVRSRVPIAERGRWQDLSMVGNVAISGEVVR